MVMPEKWKLTGDWQNTCSCDPGCPCLFWSDPTTGSCEAIDTFHFRTGNYGRTSLAGLNAVMASRAPGNFWKGNWSAAMYLDEKANSKQREALEIVMGGKAGGVPAVLAGMITNMWGLKYAKINFNPTKREVSIPGIVESILDPNVGGDKKKPITIGNHPFAPAFTQMSMGKSRASKFTDHGQSWDHPGKDGNWATFSMKGP